MLYNRERAKFIYLKFICVARFCLFWPNKNTTTTTLCSCFADLYKFTKLFVERTGLYALLVYSWTFCIEKEKIQYCDAVHMLSLYYTLLLYCCSNNNGKSPECTKVYLIALKIQNVQTQRYFCWKMQLISWWNASKGTLLWISGQKHGTLTTMMIIKFCELCILCILKQ